MLLHQTCSDRLSYRKVYNDILNDKMRMYHQNQKSIYLAKNTIQEIVKNNMFLDITCRIYKELEACEPSQKFNILHDIISSLDQNNVLFQKYLQLIYFIIKKYHPAQISREACGFYFELLFSNEYCLLASKIIYEAFEQNIEIQFLFQKIFLFILTSNNIYDLSSLILIICRHYNDNYECYFDLLLNDVIQLIFHKSFDVFSDGIESLYYLTQLNKVNKIREDILKELIEKIFICLYSEDPRTISFSIQILTYFEVNPLLYFKLLQQFLFSKIPTIELSVIDCIKHFSNLLIESNHESKIKELLFKASKTEPRLVQYRSLITLLYFNRSNEENVTIINDLIPFTFNEDTQIDSLNHLLLLLQTLKNDDHPSPLTSTPYLSSALDELLNSNDKLVSTLANEIYSTFATLKNE